MFRLGQQITITQSNLSSSRHPNIGDRGFLGNVFLFPLEMFAVAEIFFYHYADSPSNRCERKMVAINLSSNDSLTPYYKTQSNASLLEFLSNERSAINLCSPTPDCFRTDELFRYNNLLWPWFGRRTTDNLNKNAKIPIIQFRPIDLPEALTTSTGALCAWVNSMRPWLLEAEQSDEHRNLADRITALIPNTRCFGTGQQMIYATPKTKRFRFKDRAWFESNQSIKGVVLILRKLEAIFKINKKNAFRSWLKTNAFSKDTRRFMYDFYTERMNFVGEMYRGIATSRSTREVITELYFMIISSNNTQEADDLIYLFGKHLLEIKGEYYYDHSREMALKLIGDQLKVIKGEKSIIDLYNTLYLK